MQQKDQQDFLLFCPLSCKVRLRYSKYRMMIERQHFPGDFMQPPEPLCIYIACKASRR